ncbi:MAG TPA: CHAT domain-containing protein, partial [Gemmatimonadaceae bacterium]
ALTLAAKARDLLEVGREAEAEQAVTEAQKWAKQIVGDRGMDRARGSILLSRGEILTQRDPRTAMLLLDSAVTAFRAYKSDLFLPNALHAAARAATKSGDSLAARRSLIEATGALERQTSQFTGASRRVTYSETAERVFDSLIRVEMDSRQPGGAFAAIERNRLAVWSPPNSSGSDSLDSTNHLTLDTVVAQMPDSALLVEYALLSDRLLIWSVSRRGSRALTVRVSRDTIAAVLGRMIDELDGEKARPNGASARLYDFLVRPLGHDLDGISRITFVPDRELFAVPFVALWDRNSTRYLLEAFDVRTAPSAVFYMQATRAGTTVPALGKGGVLVVGDPAGVDSASRRFAPLPWATVEAESVAQIHSTKALIGSSASSVEVRRSLESVSIFHFAGHAVFDANQPERSFLALADIGGKPGVLTASEIAALRPSNLKLVVLSACSTLNPRPTRNGAIGGLAFTFLRVGARAIVSSLWEVRDDATAELFVEFHRQLAKDATPSEALRRAQLAALHSSRPNLRAARTWAAFTYTGS